jgi:hypothetical protein
VGALPRCSSGVKARPRHLSPFFRAQNCHNRRAHVLRKPRTPHTRTSNRPLSSTNYVCVHAGLKGVVALGDAVRPLSSKHNGFFLKKSSLINFRFRMIEWRHTVAPRIRDTGHTSQRPSLASNEVSRNSA